MRIVLESAHLPDVHLVIILAWGQSLSSIPCFEVDNVRRLGNSRSLLGETSESEAHRQGVQSKQNQIHAGGSLLTNFDSTLARSHIQCWKSDHGLRTSFAG